MGSLLHCSVGLSLRDSETGRDGGDSTTFREHERLAPTRLLYHGRTERGDQEVGHLSGADRSSEVQRNALDVPASEVPIDLVVTAIFAQRERKRDCCTCGICTTTTSKFLKISFRSTLFR